jgi:intracellular multiplication protein IcmL
MFQQQKELLRATGETEKIVARQNFYVDGWRIMLGALPILSIALLISIGFNIYQVLRQPEPRYFATHEGRLIPIAALNLPYVDERFVLQWVTDAVSAAYAIDFMNYRSQLNAARKYFTQAGFESLENAYKERRLKMIVDGMLVSSGVVTSTPVIVGTGVVNGVFLWKVRVPVIVTLTNNSQRIVNNYMLTIVVSRTQTYENPYGIAISQFNEAPI